MAKVGLVTMKLEKGGREAEAEAEADARNGTKDLVRFVHKNSTGCLQERKIHIPENFIMYCTVCRSPFAARPGGFPARPTRATRAAAAPRLAGTSAEGRRWTCAGQGYSARYHARVRGYK